VVDVAEHFTVLNEVTYWGQVTQTVLEGTLIPLEQ
jgi:hypothetical protein